MYLASEKIAKAAVALARRVDREGIVSLQKAKEDMRGLEGSSDC